MKKPNLFIVGAPKCGTTSLCNWIGIHEHIYVPLVKEPYYFAKDLKIGRINNVEQYEQLYAGVKEKERVIVDSSTGYLFSTTAVPDIIKYAGVDAKFIVMLRNPIDMAYSLHSQIYQLTWEDISDFKKAWFIQDERVAGKSIPKECKEPKVLQYREWCMIGEQFIRFKDNICGADYHIIWFDDLKKNSYKEYLKVLNFVNVDIGDIPDFKIYNQNKVYKSRKMQLIMNRLKKYKHMLGVNKSMSLGRFNWKVQRREHMSDEMRAILIKELKEDIHMLGKATGRDLSEWTK